MTRAHLTVEFLGGTDIDSACMEAVRIANMLRVIVNFSFNGVRVMAKPDVSPQLLASEWQHQLGSTSPIKIACVHPEQEQQ